MQVTGESIGQARGEGRRGRGALALLRRGLAALAVAALLLAAGSAGSRAAESTPGAVYTITNEAAGNRVAFYNRAADGRLSFGGYVATGGQGSGNGLGSQGALVLSRDNRLLFAVNAGSNTVSSFAVEANGLRLLGQAPSGGVRPTSLTAHGNLLYVLNAGGAGNISGLTIGSDGGLTPLPGSTRPLSSTALNPAQVEFSPDGRVLVVAERGNNVLSTYTVGVDGRANGPSSFASAGIAPFGFAFNQRGYLIVSETFAGAPGGSAASSYAVSPAGALSVVSPSATTRQTAACWLAVSKDGRFAYTANAGSGSISGFRIGADGSLTLITANGRTGVTGDGSGPIDLAVSNDGRYLYSLGNGSHALTGFRIEADGSLTPAGVLGGVITGAVGLAAR